MSTPEVNPWTEERVTELKKLHKEGLSAMRIAVLLGGLTRNAVIGKCHRLGLERSVVAKRQTIAQTNKLRAKADRPAAKPKPAKVVPLRPVEPAAFVGPSKLLGDLENGECHWPINDPGPGRMDETRFCAAPGAPNLSEGVPYCEHHHRRATQPSRPRKPAAEPTPIRRRAC